MRIEEQVLRLDVTVDNSLGVAVLEGGAELAHVLGGDLGSVPALGLAAEILVELTLGRELGDEVDTRRIVEVAVKTDDVRVSEVRLDLNFALELVLDAGPLELLLEHYLDSNDITRNVLTSKVHIAKLAVAEITTDLEVLQLPCPLL
jgi:hypothetical protein